MKTVFEEIKNNLRNKASISTVTKELKDEVSKGNISISDVLLSFIKYLKINNLNEKNSKTFEIIESYFNSEISLIDLSKELFLKRIGIDQDKRDGHTPQFQHKQDETFLDEMLRVFYEFTRSDLENPKGVCFDFCLFIAGLQIAKNEPNSLYIWNSIERSSGENNYILFEKGQESIMVLDPFNERYEPVEKYNLSSVGFKLVELEKDNLLKESMTLTGYDQGIVDYKELLKYFGVLKKTSDSDLEFLRQHNYYERLGVSKNASFEEIKLSFKKLIAKYHPDIHPNNPFATEKTQLIVEAYTCLKNEVLKREYDLSLEKESQSISQKENQETSTTHFDGELERMIREFQKKYNVDSYEGILESLTRPTKEKITRESSLSDLKYNNFIKKEKIINNIYDIDKISNIENTYHFRRSGF